MERVAIFGIIELTLHCNGTGTLTLSTDLPSGNMEVRETKPIAITTQSRQVVRYRLQGTTKGHLYSVKVVPIGFNTIKLYGGRIWARLLPNPEWGWYPIPIPPTSEEWEARKLPIPPTSEEWEARPLPIPPTSEQWERVALPIKPTPPNPEWVDVPVDQ
jgi:hypothetical protein